MTIEQHGHDAEVVEIIDAVEGDSVDTPDIAIGTTWADVTRMSADERPPIVPAWLRNRDQRRTVVRRQLGNVGYFAGFHGLRLPWYLMKAAWYAPIGLGRTLGRVVHWASAEEGNWSLRQHAARVNDAETWVKLDNTRARRAGARWAVVGLVAVPAAAVALTVAGLGVVPVLAWQAAGAALAVLFARLGRPADEPIVARVTQGRRFTRLTGLMVRDALVSLALTGLKDPAAVEFPMPIHRDGPGYLARVNLPAGLTAVKVLEKRAELSSALRLPIDQVWPTAGPDHAGQVDLWVGYVPASAMGQPPWALAAPAARCSVFEAAPFGTDERQTPISTPLFERNFLVGGQPGSGKSYGARTLLTIAALDPTCELKVAEFKGTGDFLDYAPLCSTYAVGVDEQALQVGADIIDWALAECERRGKLIRAARERGEAPLGKVTPELAARAGSGLHPVFILLDEVHELFGWDAETAQKCERAIKRGRALGVIIVLATQIPDKTSLPPNITRCVTVRWCMAVLGQVENDMILGTGAYKRGLSATVYRPGAAPDGDAGWGIMVGLRKPGPVRSFFPTPQQAAAIVARATELRRGGVVGGAIDRDRLPARDMLADALMVMAGAPGLHWAQLAERLEALDPSVYAGVTADMVRESLVRFGVNSVVVKVGGTGARGCRRDAVEAAQRAHIDGQQQQALPVTE